MGKQWLAGPAGGDPVRRLLETQWLAIILRCALGMVFIVSAWPKIIDPPGFAQMVANYRLLPEALTNPAALVLPWLELFAGVALATGIARRGAALWIALLILAFSGAIAINLARDVAVDCGCFSVTASHKSHAEMIAEMKLDLVRDLGLLIMAFFTLFTHVTWRSGGPGRSGSFPGRGPGRTV